MFQISFIPFLLLFTCAILVERLITQISWCGASIIYIREDKTIPQFQHLEEEKTILYIKEAHHIYQSNGTRWNQIEGLFEDIQMTPADSRVIFYLPIRLKELCDKCLWGKIFRNRIRRFFWNQIKQNELEMDFSFQKIIVESHITINCFIPKMEKKRGCHHIKFAEKLLWIRQQRILQFQIKCQSYYFLTRIKPD